MHFCCNGASMQASHVKQAVLLQHVDWQGIVHKGITTCLLAGAQSTLSVALWRHHASDGRPSGCACAEHELGGHHALCTLPDLREPLLRMG